MSRFAKFYNVLYIEEPIYVDGTDSSIIVKTTKENLKVLLPQISRDLQKQEENKTLSHLLNEFLINNNFNVNICWYYTPMMMQWSKDFRAEITVYDCMDELSAFKFAPVELKGYEQELLNYADLVFTGGASLYKAKADRHEAVYMFPSSVDMQHFGEARKDLPSPVDQKIITTPYIGFYGVIDERFDIKLLSALAIAKPEWNFVIIGPVVKVNPNDLPQSPNITYLGSRKYEELPSYLSGWDVALIPFAINEATKFISPTKTPEYLAGGKPVVSTPIIDVVETYGKSKVVHIADPTDIPAFIIAIEKALENSKDPKYVCEQADLLLNRMSWDKTFTDMHNLILSVKKEAV